MSRKTAFLFMLLGVTAAMLAAGTVSAEKSTTSTLAQTKSLSWALPMPDLLSPLHAKRGHDDLSREWSQRSYLQLGQASDLTSRRLGLMPGDANILNPPQYSRLAALSTNGNAQGSTAGGPGEGGKIDLEALSKQLDNPLGSLWILWAQNDTITIDGFPLKEEKVINATLLQPILPVPLTKDWLWVSRPVLSFLSVPVPKLDTSGFGEFPNLFPGGPSFEALSSNVQTDRKLPRWLRGSKHLSGASILKGQVPAAPSGCADLSIRC